MLDLRERHGAASPHSTQQHATARSESPVSSVSARRGAVYDVELITYCTPDLSNLVSFSIKLILDVVSGTLLIHTKIFIPLLTILLNFKIKYYSCIIKFFIHLYVKYHWIRFFWVFIVPVKTSFSLTSQISFFNHFNK